jgi:NADPH-dependent ferric siderophore reductase
VGTDEAVQPAKAAPGSVDVRGGGLEASALLARLPGTSVLDLEVAESLAVTPAMRRLRLRAAGLADFSYQPGQDLMVAVPAEGQGSFRRRYTIRRLDRSAGLLDLDVVLHGDGPGARWAASATTGDHIEAIGPRGKIVVDPKADWHLMVGDESGLPGFFAMIESLPAGSAATAIIEIDGPEEEQRPDVTDGVDVDLRWLHRQGGPGGTPEGLIEAVSAWPPPAGSGHAYLSGELSVVAHLRRVLESRGLAGGQLSPKAYWRLGVANAAHGEPLGD